MNKLVVVTCLVLLISCFIGLLGGIAWFKYKGWPRSAALLAIQMQAGSITSDDGGKTLPYRLYVPARQGQSPMPLVLILHGGSGRGTDNMKQLNHDVKRFVSSTFQQLQPAFVLAPQCPKGFEWTDNKMTSSPAKNYDMHSSTASWSQQLIVRLISQLTDKYAIDTSRIYITGFSMGATGSWEMLYHYPQLFAAAAILNGRSDPAIAATLKNIPISIFHGKDDTISPITNSFAMYQALKSQNDQVMLHVLNGGHGISDQSYTPDLYHWLISFRKKDT